VAIKGVPGLFRPLVEDERRRRQRRRRKTRTGLQVEPIGVDQGKGLLYARLKLPQAPTQASPRPGYVHFPRGGACDDEYFAQIGAERLVTKFRGSRPFQEWVQTRPRNEALDCLVYALAAMRLSNVDLAQVTARRVADPAYTPRAVGLRPLPPPPVPLAEQEGEEGLPAGVAPAARPAPSRPPPRAKPPRGRGLAPEGWGL
jgi:phage terminase large subunit GpA-like protein